MTSRRVAGLLAVSLAMTLLGPASRSAATQTPEMQVELSDQTSVVPPLGTFVLRVRLTGVPADGSLRMVLHQRVRSRSELAASMEGDGLRSRILDTISPLTALPVQSDGTRRLTLSLDPAGGGVTLPTEGVYPMEVIALGPAGVAGATLVTHLIVGPAAGATAPPLGVAVVAGIGAAPALQPDGSSVLDRGDVDAMTEMISGLSGAPSVPATVAASPETLDALAASAVLGDLELVTALRSALAGRAVLATPYVGVSLDALVTAGLVSELAAQLNRGSLTLSDALGVTPIETVALAPPSFGAAGLDALAALRIPRVVVADTQVAPIDPGLIAYTVAQPFLLTGPADGSGTTPPAPPIEALTTDSVVLDRLHTIGSPGLVASRVLSELAFLRLEQPSVARSVVLPLDPGTPAKVVQLLLTALGRGPPFEAMTLDAAFDHAAPLLDGGGSEAERSLEPTEVPSIATADALPIIAGRAHLATFVTLIGPDNPRSEPLVRHLLLASAAPLTPDVRRAHLATVEAAIDAVADTVSSPPSFTLTLTAREGTIPLTITNTSELPLHVTVHLTSGKLAFPGGDTVDLVLTDPTTRVDLAVQARATGAFPLRVDVTTPDGERTLTTTRYTVRSTAVSGVGLVLSVGAGLFLVVWWARHWRRTRRSAKLVAAHGHPASRHD